MLLNREKFFALALLWSTIMVIFLMMVSPNIDAPRWLLWPVIFGLIFGTKAIVKSGKFLHTSGMMDYEPRRKRYDDEFEKPKRDDVFDFDDDPRAMLEALDDHDREELRREIKTRLQERIETGSDEEVTSLEALLADLEKPSDSTGH
jgi:hypothetical protein